MRTLKFSYLFYNLVLVPKFVKVFIKEFISFVIFSNSKQEQRFFYERFGIFSKSKNAGIAGKWFWVHANSIGEVNASCTMIQAIRDRNYGCMVLVTTNNFTADARAKQLNIADEVLFFPFDLPAIINRFLKVFRPICVIVIECDIWPNFVKTCKEQRIPVFIVSGIFVANNSRSMKICHFYNYSFSLNHDVFKNIDYFFMQTEADAQGLAEILPGLRNISVGGNLKYSVAKQQVSQEEKSYYRKLLNLDKAQHIFLAGNVHQEECQIILAAFTQVKHKLSSAVMILAPRFMEETAQIATLLLNSGFSYVRRSQIEAAAGSLADVILLDTMGELARIYALAGVSFVGGSLVYLGDRFAGHNILEPVSCAVPVLFGPYMQNFQSLSDLFLKRGAAIQVKNSQELAYWIISLLDSPRQSQQITDNAMRIIEENQGSEQTMVSFIHEKLNSK